MFESFFGGKMKEPEKAMMPPYEALVGALPEEKRELFARLSEQVSDIASRTDGTINEDELSSNDRIIFDQHEALQDEAMGILRKTGSM